MEVRKLSRLVAAIAALGIVAAACGGGGTPETTTPPAATGTETSPAATTPPVTEGGEIVLGAEQWPECINPITSCSSATWAYWTIFELVLPYAMVLDLNGNFVASPVL